MTYTLDQIKDILNKLQTTKDQITCSCAFISTLNSAIAKAQYEAEKSETTTVVFHVGYQEQVGIPISSMAVIHELEKLRTDERAKLESLLKDL